MKKKTTIPRANQQWTNRAKQLWRAVYSGYELEEHHVELLRAACQQLSRAEEAAQAINRDGAVVKDRFGQFKEHSAVSTERQAHLAYLRILRELGLDIQPCESRGPRRPGTET